MANCVVLKYIVLDLQSEYLVWNLAILPLDTAHTRIDEQHLCVFGSIEK